MEPRLPITQIQPHRYRTTVHHRLAALTFDNLHHGQSPFLQSFLCSHAKTTAWRLAFSSHLQSASHEMYREDRIETKEHSGFAQIVASLSLFVALYLATFFVARFASEAAGAFFNQWVALL